MNPILSLVIGALALALMTGLGVQQAVDTVARGFGDILYEVGLLIAWGVLMGALLNEMGAIPRLIGVLLRVFGRRGVPYAFGLSLGTALQSIFPDVLIVIGAPLARRIAPKLGRTGVGKLFVAIACGIEVGVALFVPGVGGLALSGLLGIPLGIMMLCGAVVVIPTIVLTVATMSILFDRGFWNPATDQQDPPTEATADDEERIGDGSSGRRGGSSLPVLEQDGSASVMTRVGTLPRAELEEAPRREAPLAVLFGPLVVSLLLMAGGGVLDIAGIQVAPLEFVSAPTVALLLGLVGTMVVARWAIGRQGLERGLGTGVRESGQILLLTGAGGSLAGVVVASGLGDILKQHLNASAAAPIIMVWDIAALLHVAIGSITTSAITAAGLLAPIAGELGIAPVLIALAAGAGSLFLVHVTSNTFWLLQSMLGQTTRGALKTVTMGVSFASVIALGLVLLLLSLFL